MRSVFPQHTHIYIYKYTYILIYVHTDLPTYIHTNLLTYLPTYIPAEASGLFEKGDIIVEVNGKSLEGVTHEDAVRTLKEVHCMHVYLSCLLSLARSRHNLNPSAPMPSSFLSLPLSLSSYPVPSISRIRLRAVFSLKSSGAASKNPMPALWKVLVDSSLILVPPSFICCCVYVIGIFLLSRFILTLFSAHPWARLCGPFLQCAMNLRKPSSPTPVRPQDPAP